MSDATLHAHSLDPDSFAVQVADSIESFIVAVTEVAKGDEPDSAVPFLLLEVSQLLLAGGRLGAHEDIVPDERYRAGHGPRPGRRRAAGAVRRDAGPGRRLLGGLRPYEPRRAPVPSRISDSLADIVMDLRHGLAHYRAGRTSEALWWWQFSYFSNWGPTASATLRALQSLVAHVRLDQPLEALDGLDTDEADEDEDLAEEAGRVMVQEIAAPWACAPTTLPDPSTARSVRACRRVPAGVVAEAERRGPARTRPHPPGRAAAAALPGTRP